MTLSERFWSKVGIGAPNECWNWTACVSARYGQIGVDGKLQKSNRVAFYLTHGRWPEPCARHTCDNTLCCNPAHIVEGTQVQNMEDRNERGRQARKESHGRVKLTAAEVGQIRHKYKTSAVLQRELAEEFGVSRSHVSSLVSHRYWHD